MAPAQTDVGASAVLDMLREDHQKVNDLFEEFKHTDDSREKRRIVEQALADLEVHAKLEETLIYPAIRQEIENEDLMDESLEEHHVVHVLVKELKKMKPSSDRYDAKFTVLGETVKHHVEEEEGEMFPMAEEADLDWDHLAQRAMKRKEQLTSKMAPSSRNGGKSSKRAKSKKRQR